VRALTRFERIYVPDAIFLIVQCSIVGEHSGVAVVVVETMMLRRTMKKSS